MKIYLGLIFLCITLAGVSCKKSADTSQAPKSGPTVIIDHSSTITDRSQCIPTNIIDTFEGYYTDSAFDWGWFENRSMQSGVFIVRTRLNPNKDTVIFNYHFTVTVSPDSFSIAQTTIRSDTMIINSGSLHYPFITHNWTSDSLYMTWRYNSEYCPDIINHICRFAGVKVH